MAKRKDSSTAKKGNSNSGSGFSFAPKDSESRVKKREATAATLTPSSLAADTAPTETVPNGKPVPSTTA